MNPQDDKKNVSDRVNTLEDSSNEKASLSRRLISKTIQHAQDAVEFASDTSRNLSGVADAALDAFDHVSNQTKRGVLGETQCAAWCLKPVKLRVKSHWSWQEPHWVKVALPFICLKCC